ncbi:MAG TPA: peptidylprolyl isomerase [Wenzhouxiangellaceae bacterium]|nr:peptidylprolyl isomerase [Wenzhouxiangellaceae bacterium]
MYQAAIRFSAMVLALLLPLVAGAQSYQKMDEIVAIVDEGVILRSELESTMDSVLRQIQQRGDRQPPPQVLEEQVLERLIMNQVQVQRAEQTGIRVTDQEVDRSLVDVAQQNQLTLIQLRQAVEADGLDFNEFREDVRKQLLTSKLTQRIVESMDEITDTEVDMLIESDMFGSDEYHLSQIALQLSQSATPADLREAEQRINEIRQQIIDGMDFAEAAVNFSNSPDALDGGEVGWRNLNTMPHQIADRIRDLETGEISEPMLASGSLMLIKVNERRPRGEVIIDEFQARHIMVEPSELVSPEDARILIENLHKRIKDGAEFGELAREFSDDERTANIGGLMDWFPEGAYGQTFQAVCNSLEPGEVSQPFQTDEAWHLVMLEGERKSDRTAEALRAEARDLIVQQRSQEEIDRVLRQMRDEAYVEVLL